MLLLLISLCTDQLLHAQVANDSLRVRKTDNYQLSLQYHAKGKALQITGFALFGAGLAATIGGFAGLVNNYNFVTGEGQGYAYLTIAGLAAISVSIPVVINGFHYKRKARLVMRHENPSATYHIPFNASRASVGLLINF